MKDKKIVKAGSSVTIKNSTTNFTAVESIVAHAKGKKYKIHQVKGDTVLLKSGKSYIGWVKQSDV